MVTDRRDFGTRFVQTRVPKLFPIGSIDTHGQILGWSYALVRSIFALVGIVLLVHNAIG